MKLNLFCFIIFPLNLLTITLGFQNINQAIEANEALKRSKNITEEEERDTAELPGVQFPRKIYEVYNEDPCILSPCGRNFWHWEELVYEVIRRICLPNYVKSPPKCIKCWRCPVHPEPIPCLPSPCGPHSQCTEENSNVICRCQKDFIGTPPNCRRECTINSECASDKACLNRKCVDPCVYKCARNANCTVIAHNPICSCQDGFAGNPFTNCMPLSIPTQRPEVNPCIPFPCGPYSQCQELNGHARCTCLPNYSSSPPRCSLECIVHSQCDADMTCINNKCTNPCPRACGNYAECIVKDHIPYCKCLPDSCQALDQTHYFPRYPEWSHKFGYPKEEAVLDMGPRPKEPIDGVERYCSRSCGSAASLGANCPWGTERFNDFCVEIDPENDSN